MFLDLRALVSIQKENNLCNERNKKDELTSLHIPNFLPTDVFL